MRREDVRLPKNDLAVIILDNLAKFPHCILLTRVGNFYEVCIFTISPSQPFI